MEEGREDAANREGREDAANREGREEPLYYVGPCRLRRAVSSFSGPGGP
jgi:hypothetical protein